MKIIKNISVCLTDDHFSGMTVTDAARKHQVPRNTLDDRVKKLGIPVTTHVTMDPSQYRGSRGAWLPPSDVKPDAANELHTTLDIEEFNPVECNVEMEEIETKPCLKTLNIGARNIGECPMFKKP